MAQAEDESRTSDHFATPQGTSGVFTGGGVLEERERRPLKPFLIAGAVVVLLLAVLLVAGHQKPRDSNPGGAGLAPVAAYARLLTISQVKMSESTNLSGGKITYLDGILVNHGSQTVQGAVAQVAFQDFTNQLAAKITLPIDLIRTHEPYIDTEPVSAAPIGPGQSHEFRLIFDSVPNGWNGAYPTVRIIKVDAH
jgi:hypothetical protein